MGHSFGSGCLRRLLQFSLVSRDHYYQQVRCRLNTEPTEQRRVHAGQQRGHVQSIRLAPFRIDYDLSFDDESSTSDTTVDMWLDVNGCGGCQAHVPACSMITTMEEGGNHGNAIIDFRGSGAMS